MQFNITVIQVTETKGKKNARGGVYNAVNVVYKRDGKVEAKDFPDWANKDIYETLQGLAKDGEYTVTTEKVDGFWKWLNVQPIGSNADALVGGVDNSREQRHQEPVVATGSGSLAGGTHSNQTKAGTGKVLGSNYETKEERAHRQKLIVAQSSLSAAIDFAKAIEPKGSTHHLEDVKRNAEEFYNWVFSVTTKDLSDIESDIPQ